jgi:predicted GNAT family N-acyltransferase
MLPSRSRDLSDRFDSLCFHSTMRTDFQVKQISSEEAKARAFAIRMRVFVREQGVPQEIELDADDARAIHLLAFGSGRAVGTARIVLRRGSAKIGRMAVLQSFRRKGVGKALLRRALAIARQRGAPKIYLHAQVPVIGFYEKQGFVCAGPVFEEAGDSSSENGLGVRQAAAGSYISSSEPRRRNAPSRLNH